MNKTNPTIGWIERNFHVNLHWLIFYIWSWQI